ncbi:MAG: transposase, partial [Opitutus sp.]
MSRFFTEIELAASCLYCHVNYMDPLGGLTTVDESFFEPALRLVREHCRHRRDTLELTDEQFLRSGIQRVLGQCDSGRDFLQARQDRGEELARSTWFDALHSKRRGMMVAEVATRSYEIFTRYLAQRDWLGAFPELKDRAVWAVDGHQIAHACHAQTDAKDEYVPVGELYGLCLHSGLLRAMAPFQGDGVRRHEFPVFKEHLPRWVRQDRGKFVPIIVGDPAYIDILYWSEQRRMRQAVVITREKENMKPTVISRYAYDANDPVNRGVEADEMAGYTYAYLRRIVYCDPASGERFVFVTTDLGLRPGVIAMLYALRWKIEKAYDVFKNKLHQQKAWATGATAAHIQAHLIALTHNLLTILLCRLESAGLREAKVLSRARDLHTHTPTAQRVPS